MTKSLHADECELLEADRRTAFGRGRVVHTLVRRWDRLCDRRSTHTCDRCSDTKWRKSRWRIRWRRCGIRKQWATTGAKGRSKRGSRFRHHHAAMMFACSATASREAAVSVLGKNRRADQREAEQRNQQICDETTHCSSVYFGMAPAACRFLALRMHPLRDLN